MKLYKIILAAGFLYLTSSCSQDFLDTKPMTSKTDATYYTTADEAEEALVGCYDGIQNNYDGNALPVCAMTVSDLCFGGTGATDADDYRMIDEYDMNIAPSYMNFYSPMWVAMYKTIYRCNMLLTRLDQVDWGTNPDRAKTIEAEARFLRAFTYFDMVRMWERVPVLTEPSIENIPQSEPDVTYKLIAEDLLFAAQNLDPIAYNSIPKDQLGHATKWAAESLLGRVFLYYTGYYGKDDLVGLVSKSQALSYLEDVISNSGHGLLNNFFDLWPAAARYQAAINGKALDDNTYAGETNKEVIFSVRYTYTDYYDGNRWLIMNGLRLQTWKPLGYDTGWGANTVVADVYKNWDPNDDRRDASIIAIDEEGIDFTNRVNAKEYTGYYTKKYTPMCDSLGHSYLMGGTDHMTNQFQDYIVLRYADVLLMAAELGSSNALNYVNQVRERSHAAPVTAVDKDVIYEERMHELAFEGVRYWDLLRYDHTLAYAAQKVTFHGLVKNGDVDVEKNIDGANLIATRGLFQIPYDQITLSNGVLTQNPGW